MSPFVDKMLETVRLPLHVLLALSLVLIVHAPALLLIVAIMLQKNLYGVNVKAALFVAWMALVKILLIIVQLARLVHRHKYCVRMDLVRTIRINVRKFIHATIPFIQPPLPSDAPMVHVKINPNTVLLN